MEAAEQQRVVALLEAQPGFDAARPADLERFVKSSALHHFRPGQDVVRQGDYGETLFMVLSGSVLVRVRRASGEETVIAILRRGEIFGELSVLSQRPRNSTVTANQTLAVLEVPRDAVGRLLKACPSLLRRFDRLYRYRVIATNIHADPLFEGLLPEALQQLVDTARLRGYEKDEVVIEKGQAADSFFIVWSGHLRVCSLEDGKERILGYLGEGDYFGETALMEGGTRTATVKANSRCEVVEIARERFEALIASDSELLSGMRERAEQRRKQALAIQARSDKVLFIEDMLKVGAGHATGALLINLDLCVKCGNCSVACHQRFGVSRLVRRGSTYTLPEGQARVLMPSSCWHCRDPECMIDCPTDALRRQPTGEISIIEDRCIGCEICANQCPWGNISMAPVESFRRPGRLPRLLSWLRPAAGRTSSTRDGSASTRKRIKAKAVKCDLCRDYEAGPACIAACPYGAMDLLDPNRYLQHAMEELTRV